jgi:threonine dehydrogenase-like Zn-dependent dehydrogenase
MISRGLFGKKFLDIDERKLEIGAPDEDHVVVKIHACGVCGTDVNFVRDWPDDPMPLGHEIAAEVMEVGKNVRNVKPGDRVIVEDVAMCGVCKDCKSGHPEFCRNLITMEDQPGMGEYMSVRFNCLDKFEGLDYKHACLTEPLAVSLSAVQHAQIPLGGTVVVLGNGPLGLMAAKLAKLQGASFVAITGLVADNEREKARHAAAAKFGCDMTIEVGKQSVEDEILSKYPDGVDRVIVSSPPESMYDAFKIIRYGGIITFFGLHFGGKNMVNVDINDMIFRKISMIPTFAEPAIGFPTSTQLLKDGLIDADALVNCTFGFDDAKSVLGAIVDGSKPIIKAVLTPHG